MIRKLMEIMMTKVAVSYMNIIKLVSELRNKFSRTWCKVKSVSAKHIGYSITAEIEFLPNIDGKINGNGKPLLAINKPSAVKAIGQFTRVDGCGNSKIVNLHCQYGIAYD